MSGTAGAVLPTRLASGKRRTLLRDALLLQDLPHFLGRDRDVEVRHTEMPERVDYGVRNRRRRTHRCRLSHTLRAEGMVRRGRGGLVGLPMRGLERRGHVVVHEAAA